MASIAVYSPLVCSLRLFGIHLAPGPETVAGVYIRAAYEFYRWEEGPGIMIWHDAIQSSSCASTSNEQVFVMDCHALSEDGYRFDWSLEIKDSIAVDFFLNDQEFDLADGDLFVIATSGEGIKLRQLQRDVSQVQPNAEQVIDFGLAETAVHELLQTTSGIQDCVSSAIEARETLGTADAQAAQQALTAFFSHLHAGDYEGAVDLYGGSYDVMQDHNPGIDPDDRAALLRNACTINGAQCLEIRRANLIGRDSPIEFRFSVEFSNEDGSLFSLGPCCGDRLTGRNYQHEFIYTVKMECTGRYKVYDMPIYLP